MLNRDGIPYEFFRRLEEEVRLDQEHELKCFWMGESSELDVLNEFPIFEYCPFCKTNGSVIIPGVIVLFAKCAECGVEVEVWKERDLQRERDLRRLGFYDRWVKTFLNGI